MIKILSPKARNVFLGMGLTLSLFAGLTACTDENSDSGIVVSITDGDTLVASINGEEQTVRLLNIDTPETKDPNKPVECLGEEATQFLTNLLPVGSDIKLMYDVERTDRYQRTLAAVFTSDDRLASAEIARAGLGTAMVVGKNDKFLPPVEDAQEEAKKGSRGIYDSSEECTLPAQIAVANDALESASTAGSEVTSTGTAAVIAVAAGSITAAQALQALLKASATGTDIIRWAAFSTSELTAILGNLSDKITDAENNVKKLKAKETSLKTSEDEAIKKAAEEASRALAAEQAAAKAQLQAQAEAAAAEAEAQRIRKLAPIYVPPAPAPPANQQPPAYQPPPQNSGANPPGYTGPRCYLPGGKSYRPC